jgi:hypothetical protein
MNNFIKYKNYFLQREGEEDFRLIQKILLDFIPTKILCVPLRILPLVVDLQLLFLFGLN